MLATGLGVWPCGWACAPGAGSWAWTELPGPLACEPSRWGTNGVDQRRCLKGPSSSASCSLSELPGPCAASLGVPV